MPQNALPVFALTAESIDVAKLERPELAAFSLTGQDAPCVLRTEQFVPTKRYAELHQILYRRIAAARRAAMPRSRACPCPEQRTGVRLTAETGIPTVAVVGNGEVGNLVIAFVIATVRHSGP